MCYMALLNIHVPSSQAGAGDMNPLDVEDCAPNLFLALGWEEYPLISSLGLP